jgi:hypothetical protein
MSPCGPTAPVGPVAPVNVNDAVSTVPATTALAVSAVVDLIANELVVGTPNGKKLNGIFTLYYHGADALPAGPVIPIAPVAPVGPVTPVGPV